MNCEKAGDLSSLKWFEGNLNFSSLKVHAKHFVNVSYSALNFRDCMLATGRLSEDSINTSLSRIERQNLLGMEYSGVNALNKRIFGFCCASSMATKLLADPQLVWDCPDNWTLEEAATVPVVYATVYYALFIMVKIQKGQKILIHAGTGGVGLAAIETAFRYGLHVFTTVSNNTKRQYLLNKFPKLKASQIGCSRDTSFYEMVMFETNGQGVDYVLNSLASEKLVTSIKCLGTGGKFLEIGKFDMENNSKIGLAPFLKEISFHSVILDSMFTGATSEKQLLHSILEKDIKAGFIKPLRTTIFEAGDVEQAFRYLASAKHIGKVLLKIREDENDDTSMPISVSPRIHCNPDLTYIVIGGLGGFGLELVDWLILRGCRKLVLGSSRGLTKPYQCYRLR